MQKVFVSKTLQEMWANAHETRDSISVISYAGSLGLSSVIWAKIHFKCAPQPEIAKKSLKPVFWGFKVIDVDTPGKLISSACHRRSFVRDGGDLQDNRIFCYQKRHGLKHAENVIAAGAPLGELTMLPVVG